ncbi:MAG: hypothetical protein J0H66_14660 [Solirubrobacterales bacterium]|nr:hypothetical protein [Solirubrobacterales bacterium]OJU95657.1 MAG: hypothetical protein BGO23_08595 [Solirubrobacterales bacterium 67-14]
MSSEAATESSVRRPRRPKRKLNTPVNLALGAILIAVVAFWLGGKLKGDDDSAASGLPAGMPSMSAGSDSGSGMGGFPGAAGSGGDSTQGEITSVAGDVLYVETSDGTTIKVKAGKATVTRNAKAKASQLHPGDTVTVTGKKNKAGAVKATDVTATQSGVQSAMPSFGGGMPSGMSAPGGDTTGSGQ